MSLAPLRTILNLDLTRGEQYIPLIWRTIRVNAAFSAFRLGMLSILSKQRRCLSRFSALNWHELGWLADFCKYYTETVI